MVLSQLAGPAWQLNLTGNATLALTDNIVGYLSNIKLLVTPMGGPGCTFRISGAAGAVFRENPIAPLFPPTQRLAVSENSGNLSISHVSGCLGLISTGNTTSFSANYDLATPTGYINVTP